jgi:hypothetical protein
MKDQQISFSQLIITFLALCVTLIFSYLSWREVKIIKSAEFMLEFNKELNQRDIYDVLDKASKNEPILIQNGGKYIISNLNDVLGIFEDIYVIKSNNILTDDMIYSSYDDDLETICVNKEFQDYMKLEQQKDPEL